MIELICRDITGEGILHSTVRMTDTRFKMVAKNGALLKLVFEDITGHVIELVMEKDECFKLLKRLERRKDIYETR